MGNRRGSLCGLSAERLGQTDTGSETIHEARDDVRLMNQDPHEEGKHRQKPQLDQLTVRHQ
eukprot:319243-Rhodomonas_salina.2